MKKKEAILGTKKDFIQAVKDGNVEVVKKFIRSGIDINNIRDNKGITVLELAVIRRQKEVVMELIKAGAEFNNEDISKENILELIVSTYGLAIHHSIKRPSEEDYRDYDNSMVELLLSLGVEIQSDCYDAAIYFSESVKLISLLRGAQIIDQIFNEKKLSTSDKVFLQNSHDLNIEMFAQRFISLFKMYGKGDILSSSKSFNSITEGTILSGLIDSDVGLHFAHLDESVFLSFIPIAFGLKKYTKKYLDKLCKDNNIEYRELVNNRDLLEREDANFENDDVFSNFILLHGLYLQRNYVSDFITQIYSGMQSFPIDLEGMEQASPNKPSKAIKSLLRDPNIYLSNEERSHLKESSQELLEAQFEPVLAHRGLHAVDVDKDGNCFFHALARYFNISHGEIRQMAIGYMLEHPEQFQGFEPRGLDEYIAEVSQEGEWADNLVIQALVNQLQILLNIYRQDGTIITIFPNNGAIANVVIEVAYTGNHYLAIEENNVVMDPVVRANETNAAATDFTGSLTQLGNSLLGVFKPPHYQDDSDVL